MPLHLVLDEADALALDSVGDDEVGFAGLKWHLLDGLQQVTYIISVTTVHRVTECLELVCECFQSHDLFSETGDLQTVTIHDYHQVVQFVMSSGHRSFPVRP